MNKLTKIIIVAISVAMVPVCFASNSQVSKVSKEKACKYLACGVSNWKPYCEVREGTCDDGGGSHHDAML